MTQTVEMDPIDLDHEYTLIFMHGLTHHMSGLIQIFRKMPTKIRLRIVMPRAPEREVVYYEGCIMSTWFNL
jgi:hypothetical protein